MLTKKNIHVHEQYEDRIWKLHNGNGPIVAAAIHHGHELRNEIKEIISLSEQERFREEDPFTGEWAKVGDIQIVGRRSRFEIDLNRPRDKAIYLKPDDAWGLNVWKKEPSKQIIQNSLDEYDAFYNEMFKVFKELKSKHKHFVALDLHTYNHMREGPEGQPADAVKNPEVNIGTGTINSDYWSSIVNGFIDDLKKAGYMGRTLDVRENIRFKGGYFSRWVNEKFPHNGCAIAIEFKKIFMDECTGKPDIARVDAIHKVLESTISGIRHRLSRM